MTHTIKNNYSPELIFVKHLAPTITKSFVSSLISSIRSICIAETGRKTPVWRSFQILKVTRDVMEAKMQNKCRPTHFDILQIRP